MSPSAQLAHGCVPLAGPVVNADAQLERGVLVNSGAVVDHEAICVAYSQLGVNAAMAGGSLLGPLASLSAGEVLGCGEHRFAELELAPGAADLSEGVSCAGFSSRSAGLLCCSMLCSSGGSRPGWWPSPARPSAQTRSPADPLPEQFVISNAAAGVVAGLRHGQLSSTTPPGPLCSPASPCLAVGSRSSRIPYHLPATANAASWFATLCASGAAPVASAVAGASNRCP